MQWIRILEDGTIRRRQSQDWFNTAQAAKSKKILDVNRPYFIFKYCVLTYNIVWQPLEPAIQSSNGQRST